MGNDIKRQIMRKILTRWVEFIPEAENLQNHQLQVGLWLGQQIQHTSFCAPQLERRGRFQKRCHPCHNEEIVKRKWASLSIL